MSYSESHWRNTSAEIIAKVLRETVPNSPERKQALYDAYPFGQRKHHPYKIWRHEMRRQLAKPAKFLQEGEKIVFPDAPL